MIEQIDGRAAAFEEAFREVRGALARVKHSDVMIAGSDLGTPEESWGISAYLLDSGGEQHVHGHGPTFTEAAAAFVKDLGRFSPDEEE